MKADCQKTESLSVWKEIKPTKGAGVEFSQQDPVYSSLGEQQEYEKKKKNENTLTHVTKHCMNL